MLEVDLLIIGGGTAGLIAALESKKQGIDNILILEKEDSLGGALNQCINTGYGEEIFGEDMTGPEFIHRLVESIEENYIKYELSTFVMSVDCEKVVTFVNAENGVVKAKAKAIIVATGAKERPRGSMNILGSKYAGVLTVGTAQKLINEYGILPGKEVVILGSRDLGMVMARTLIFEGANVKAIIEFRPYIGGIEKVYEEFVKSFDIPIKFNSTVIEVKGKERVKGVVIANVGPDKKYIRGTEEFIECDTVLLSVGLEPQNEILKELEVEVNEFTRIPCITNRYESNLEGIFICGNALHIHDYVATTIEESRKAAYFASGVIKEEYTKKKKINIEFDKSIKYLIPKYLQYPIDKNDEDLDIGFRVNKVRKNAEIIAEVNGNIIYRVKRKYITPSEVENIKVPMKYVQDNNIESLRICVCDENNSHEEIHEEIMCQCCTLGCMLNVTEENGIIVVSNNLCKRGEEFGNREYQKESRVINYKVKVKNGDFSTVPVKTDKEVSKADLVKVLDILRDIEVEAPFDIGEIIIENIANTQINVISTRKINGM